MTTCPHFEDRRWCAPCTGRDRPSVDGTALLGSIPIEVFWLTGRPSDRGGVCPGCGEGYSAGVFVFKPTQPGPWVPRCCAEPIGQGDAVRDAFFAHLDNPHALAHIGYPGDDV